MEKFATIDGERFDIGEFDVCTLVAHKYGLTDLDIEPWAGSVTITAKREDGTPVKVRAETLVEATAKFVSQCRQS